MLVSADLLGSTWRPVFLLNVPIGVILFLAGLRTLPRRARASRAAPWTWPGWRTLTPAVLALILPLVLGQSEHWPAWGWACLAASGVLFALFAVVRAPGRRPWWRTAGPRAAAAAARGRRPGSRRCSVSMAVFGGFFFVLALHLQGGLGDSPMRAGLTFAPAGLAFALVSLNWQRLPARWHLALSIAGFVAYGAGLLVLAVLLRGGGQRRGVAAGRRWRSSAPGWRPRSAR